MRPRAGRGLELPQARARTRRSSSRPRPKPTSSPRRLAAERGLWSSAGGRPSARGWFAGAGTVADRPRGSTSRSIRTRGRRQRPARGQGSRPERAAGRARPVLPLGHCPSVGIGGFLLQGGWGWNSRAIGPACMSIVGVDVVTAAGELIHADANENSDYWWAARGSGGGYFGVVTRFDLRCHPRPTATYTRTDVYSLDEIDTILHWALEFEPTQPAEFEFAILGTTPTLPDGRTVHDGTALMLMCQALMYDEDDARARWAALTSVRSSTARCIANRPAPTASQSSTTAPIRSSPRVCAGPPTACGPTRRPTSWSIRPRAVR